MDWNGMIQYMQNLHRLAFLHDHLGLAPANDIAGYLRNALKVFRRKIFILDAYAKLRFDERDHIQNPKGIDDPAFDQGIRNL